MASSSVSVSPFKVLEDIDLNYQTPRSTRVKKKLFNCDNDNDRPTKKIQTWNDRFLCKYSFQPSQWNFKTPPTNDYLSVQPLAPVKPRKFIDKGDLKPKKLDFKEEPEPNISENYRQSKITDEIRVVINDDKENRFNYFSYSNEINSTRVSSHKVAKLKLTKKPAVKHLRI